MLCRNFQNNTYGSYSTLLLFDETVSQIYLKNIFSFEIMRSLESSIVTILGFLSDFRICTNKMFLNVKLGTR